MHQGDRPLAEDAGVADADLADLADRPRHAGVHGDEVALPQEEVDVLRVELVLPRAEVDAVENQIQIVAVRLDLRMVQRRQSVFHRQLVEVEDAPQDLRLFRGRDD